MRLHRLPTHAVSVFTIKTKLQNKKRHNQTIQEMLIQKVKTNYTAKGKGKTSWKRLLEVDAHHNVRRVWLF